MSNYISKKKLLKFLNNLYEDSVENMENNLTEYDNTYYEEVGIQDCIDTIIRNLNDMIVKNRRKK